MGLENGNVRFVGQKLVQGQMWYRRSLFHTSPWYKIVVKLSMQVSRTKEEEGSLIHIH